MTLTSNGRGSDLGRVVGFDMARCLALVGMMTTHILPGVEGFEVPWPQQLAGGRAAALFAVLAGVSMSLMSGRTLPVRGRERIAVSSGLAVRALLIAALGLFLAQLETNVAIILTYYGLLFLLGLPFLGLGARALTLLSAGWMVVLPILSHLLRPELPERGQGSPSLAHLEHPLLLLSELSFTGTYPVVPWLTYLLAGMAIGRLDLRPAKVAWWLFGVGLVLVAASWALSGWLSGSEEARDALRTTYSPGFELTGPELDVLLAHGLFGVTPTETWWWLTVAAPHSSTPFDFAQTVGSAIAVIGLCLLVSRLNPRLFAVLFGAGAMTLTLYSLHIVMLTPEFLPPEVPNSYGIQVVTVLGIGMCFAAFGLRGPLEYVVRRVSSAAADAVRAGTEAKAGARPSH